MGDILIGTCSWTDPGLVDTDVFYPKHVKTAEERLRFYSSEFSIVEVDSTYYSLPAKRTSELWVERTPSKFIFDIKAFRLFTQHPTPIKALPKDIRDSLDTEKKEQPNIYLRDIPEELVDSLWERYRNAIIPLYQSKKLGVVLLQLPPWFHPGDQQREYIINCKERLPQYQIAVEFRQHSWVSETNRERTLDFLQKNGLAFVCVDEPQGFKSSVPPVAQVTGDIGIIRFHGRNVGTWEKPGLTTQERFNYLYSENELREWVPRIKECAGKTKKLHVLFNTNYQGQSVINSRQLRMLLDQDAS
jgi:uncharacterized protein YecE (DUF72 family)